MSGTSRRLFLQSAGAASVAAGVRLPLTATSFQSSFRVAVISDEVSQDFDRACAIIANDFGLEWVELRGLWGKNISTLDDQDIAKAKVILDKYRLRVTDLASPLFKTDWPDAPRSKYSPKADPTVKSYGAHFAFKQQDELLEKCIGIARQFKTDRIRCFDFWRLEDQSPHRQAIDAKLAEAAAKAGKAGLLLVLENEYECNTATGREAARTLAAVPSPHLMLNWDPGNAVARGELDAYPAGWEALPKHRIGHCHVKCAVFEPTAADPTAFSWAAVGQGAPDWTAQFRALRQSGYKAAVSLETHWSGGRSPEASSRISWAGMKAALEQAQT